MVVLTIKDKREICGNLVSAVLGDRGIDSFSYGEFFEGSPFLRIEKPSEVKVYEHRWSLEGIFRRYEGHGILEEFTSVYDDILIYELKRISGGPIELNLRGNLGIFTWFNPGLRKEIIRKVTFEAISERRAFQLSYNGTYYLRLETDHDVEVEVKEDRVEYAVRTDLSDGDKLVMCTVASSSKEEIKRRTSWAMQNPSMVREKRRNMLEDLLSKIPQKPEGVHRDFYTYLWYVILTNRCVVERHPVLKYPFNMPSKYMFRHQWLWDSAFHSVVLSWYDQRLAEEELSNLFIAQKPDGRIPHEIFLSKHLCKVIWRIDNYSPWTTQPPVLAVAVGILFEKYKNKKYIKKVLPNLIRYDKWFRNFRDNDKDQLMAYVDYLESGWDDSARWDLPIIKFKKNSQRYLGMYKRIRMAPVEAIDLNCLIYLQRKVIAYLCKELGESNLACEFEELAEKTKNGILEHMWDEEEGFFFDVFEEDHSHIKVKTPAAFLTMFAGLAERRQVVRLVKHLLNEKEFWTTFPLPTLSADDPRYNPRGYWRGRSWINIIWFTYWGLRRYGYDEVAEKLLKKTLNLMENSFTCNENYDSSTGEPLGAPDFGWSTLVLDMLMRKRPPLDEILA